MCELKLKVVDWSFDTSDFFNLEKFWKVPIPILAKWLLWILHGTVITSLPCSFSHYHLSDIISIFSLNCTDVLISQRTQFVMPLYNHMYNHIQYVRYFPTTQPVVYTCLCQQSTNPLISIKIYIYSTASQLTYYHRQIDTQCIMLYIYLHPE